MEETASMGFNNSDQEDEDNQQQKPQNPHSPQQDFQPKTVGDNWQQVDHDEVELYRAKEVIKPLLYNSKKGKYTNLELT